MTFREKTMKKYHIFFVLILLFGSPVASASSLGSPPDLTGITMLDLETAQKMALESNPDMAAALSRIEQARARLDQAAAAWWPSLDLSGRYSRIRRSDIAYDLIKLYPSSPGTSNKRTFSEGAAALHATWLLFDGFYRSFQEQQAEFRQQSAAAARRNSQRLLVNAVAEAFLNAQLAQTRVDIAAADQKFYLRQLKDAENRHRVGVGPLGDVLNIKVQVNSARTSLLLNQRQLEAAGYGLAALMGIPEGVFPPGLKLIALDTNFSIRQHAWNKPEDLIKKALKLRPDIRQLEMTKKEAEAGTELARARFYPTLQLNGTVNGSRQGDVHLSGDDIGNSITLNAAWNLFSGGADRARLFEARQRAREANWQLASLRNKVTAEIRQDLALLAAAEEQVRLQRDSVALVKENRELARNSYEAGEASLVRLNEAQRDLTTTYSRLAQALVGYHQARHRLLAATGANLEILETSDNGRQSNESLGTTKAEQQSGKTGATGSQQ